MGSDEQIFISRHLKEQNFENKIHFNIERIKSKTSKDTFDAKYELDKLKNDLLDVRADKSQYDFEFYKSTSGSRLHEVSGS